MNKVTTQDARGRFKVRLLCPDSRGLPHRAQVKGTLSMKEVLGSPPHRETLCTTQLKDAVGEFQQFTFRNMKPMKALSEMNSKQV